MSTISEIKSKYGLSEDGGVSVSFDVESLRDRAKELSRQAESLVANNYPTGDKWAARRKKELSDEIRDEKRKVSMARKFLGEVDGILDKANETLAKEK